MENSIEDEIAALIGNCESTLRNCVKSIKNSKATMSAKDFNEVNRGAKEMLKGNEEALEILKNFKKNGFKL